MSTPSGKPFDPSDPSPYAPKRARERSASDRSSAENEGESAVLLPYARKGTLRQPSAQEHPVDLDEGNSHLMAPEPDAAHQDSVPEDLAYEEQAADSDGPDESMSDADLQRLESSLRWLQREGASGRLPRAVQLSPVDGIPPVEPEESRPRGEQFINGFRVPPSLAPERLRPPPPMRERRDTLRGPLRIVLASVLAAPIAYYFSVGGLSRLTRPAPEPELASSEARTVSPTTMRIPKDPVRLPDAQESIQAAAPGNIQSTNQGSNPINIAAVSPPPDVTLPPPAAAPASIPSRPEIAPPPSQPVVAAARTVGTVRQLDPDAVKLLMHQGEQFIAAGDLVTARLVFQRAAEAGDATAALAMGATYDPIVLAKLGARGIGADVEKARGWYEKAKEFGSPEAPRRIEMLANR